MKLNLRFTVLAIAMTFITSNAFPVTANAAAQKVTYFMAGDCNDYYQEEEKYAFFESEPDWSCYLSVYVKPVKPIRQIRLQYWSGTKWKTENTAKTNSSGRGILEFDPICSDGYYCDGEFKYRVYVDSVTGQKSTTSINFYVTYYPEESDSADEDEG